jgi:hypothetical protein
MDINDVVSKYMRLRDAKKQLAERQSQEMARLTDPMRKLEAALLDHLNQLHAESVRTNNGTVYKTTRTSAKVVDWEPCLAFILEHQLTHMLERRVSKTAVEEYLAAHGELPPGVSISSELSVNIRAS